MNKILFKIGSGAFLKNGNHYLLMKRSQNRKLFPNVWCYIGGHIQKDEFNDPLKACYREIEEETGIKRNHIYNLNLRYILISMYSNIVYQNYVYFGETDEEKFIDTEEGKLHWIEEKNLLKLEFEKNFMELIEHYLQNKFYGKIIIGTTGKESNTLKMNWSILESFE